MSEPAGREAASRYNRVAVIVGVLAAIVAPILSLMVALLLRGGQEDPVKRRQLRTWAWLSGAWLIVLMFGIQRIRR